MPNTKLKFLALGDSYTIGESVPAAQSWPNQLISMLRGAAFSIENASILAQTGWTTGDLIAAIESEKPGGIFDLVSLSIGVNNQYQGGKLATYGDEFGALLGTAINFAGGCPARVLILSIPDWGVTPFAAGRDIVQIQAEIDQFNQINQEESRRAGVHYLDITALSRQVRDEPTLLAADKLHFSGKMYAAWVALMRPLVYHILRPEG